MNDVWHHPQRRDTFPHRMCTDNKLIKKKDFFDPIKDDDDIDWKYNPFDVDSTDEVTETSEQLMSQITFVGSPQLQTKLKALVLEFIDVFATKVRRGEFHIIVHRLVSIQKRSRKRYESKSMHSWNSGLSRSCKQLNGVKSI